MIKNAYRMTWQRMYGRKVRMLAAPGVGLIAGTAWSDPEVLLSDRIANGEAFPGEFVVRVPIGAYADYLIAGVHP